MHKKTPFIVFTVVFLLIAVPSLAQMCQSNKHCSWWQYCRTQPGDCDGIGQCAFRPQACLDVYNPVCGCDGETYPNACYAAMAGVSLAYGDICEDRGSCWDNEDCPGNKYCAKEPGDCDGEGTCEKRPRFCLDVYDPVCGCDGNTYSNDCYAARAGVNVDYEGVCEGGGPEECKTNADCGGFPALLFGEYCKKAPGDCDGVGVCAPRPEMCLDVWDPVCGCDGNTYSNDCYAARNGVNVDYEGPCGIIRAECTDNKECSEKEYCAKEPGDCDGKGTCEERPDFCIHLYDPVCGCDGETYPNKCEAAHAGVNVDYEGPCKEGKRAGQPCQTNADCGGFRKFFFSEYCKKDVGDCDGTGVCSPRPFYCLDVWYPVCGCDGNNYSNACYAARAGVNVEYMDYCPY